MKNFVRRRNIYSFIAIIIIAIIITCQNFNISRWESPKSVICYDVISYYSYLPATFIHNDVTLGFLDKPINHGGDFWYKTTPIGGKVIMTSMGLAMMYSPFFLIAHYTAPILGFETNGYTQPYVFALIFANLIYLIIGLFFLRKLLLYFFKDAIVAITLLAIVLSTNLYWYSTIEAAMSHGFSFSLFSIFLYLTHKWYQRQSVLTSIFIGIIYGLISLIRPTNAVIILVFILWNVTSVSDLNTKIRLFLKKYYLVLLITILTLVVWLPQLLYWKTVSGQYFYYSYGKEDGSFFWNNPHIIDVLFGFRKGWLIYNPIMWLSMIGIVILWKTGKMFLSAIVIFFIINLYIISSWWCWWYGGGYSIRALIDSYPIMTIPLAAFLTWMFKQKKQLKMPLIIILFLLFLKGSFSNVQYYYGSIHWDSMTKEAYFDSFWRLRKSENFPNLLKNPDYEKARKGIDAIEINGN